MFQELIYTSAPAGLKAGSQGFCVVACTTGMPPHLVKLLESLSVCFCTHQTETRPGDRTRIPKVFPDDRVGIPPAPNAAMTPVAYSHLIIGLGGIPRHILSRTSHAGLDDAQGANAISHHLVLDKSKRPMAGPAAVLSQYAFQTSWDRKPAILPANQKLFVISPQVRICERWKILTGDSGWGGVLAESALTKQPVGIIFRPGMDLLPLIDEAMALLRPEMRWQVTFSTYWLPLPQEVPCLWKCILSGSPKTVPSQLPSETLVIDLTRPLGKAPDGQLVEAARTGVLPMLRDATLPVSGDEQAVYGIQDTDLPRRVPVTGSAAVAGNGNAAVAGNGSATVAGNGNAVVAGNGNASAPGSVQVQITPETKRGKVKKVSQGHVGNDVASKGCFWFIILFFIVVTAGMIGGLFWLYGVNHSQQGNALAQEKTIADQQREIDEIKAQLESATAEKMRLHDSAREWEETHHQLIQFLTVKDAYLDRVAEYFSVFPSMRFSKTVPLKEMNPDKDGVPFCLVSFGRSPDKSWNLQEVLSVSITCSNDKMFCSRADAVTDVPNGMLGYSCQLCVPTGGHSNRPFAEFDLVVTIQGIFVRRLDVDTWFNAVHSELKRMYDETENQGGFSNRRLIEWYEDNVKDKPFVLDENMLNKLGDLGPDIFSDDHLITSQLIELRKDYYTGDMELKFDFDVNLATLTEFVMQAMP